MSEAVPSRMEAAVPSNRFQMLLAAFRKVKAQEECDTSRAPDKDSLTTLEANCNVQDFSKLMREPSPIPNVCPEKISSDSCSASEEERQDCSSPYDEIVWDHTMSGSEQEDSDSDSDSDSIDQALYDKWYSAAYIYQDDTSKLAGEACYESQECFEDAENSYEFEEVAIKLKELAHSDMGSYGPGKVLYEWSCDIATDEERNKIYDKWICDLESWERQRLQWLDERGKIEGFNTSCDDRTFLIRVDNREDEKPVCKTSSLKPHDLIEKDQCVTDLVELGGCSDTNNPELIGGIRRKNTGADWMKLDEPLSESEGECEPLNLPQELTSVYEFTDRNLWRKYHKCFKEGKYSNN